ncbi:hypothetical protein D3C85_1731800 [compost metagenome]
MLKKMEERNGYGKRIPFSIEWVTCNRSKNTGGEKIFVAEAVLEGSGNSKSEKRNPRHHTNYTRNIKPIESGRTMKIHPLLVTKFNNCSITL